MAGGRRRGRPLLSRPCPSGAAARVFPGRAVSGGIQKPCARRPGKNRRHTPNRPRVDSIKTRKRRDHAAPRGIYIRGWRAEEDETGDGRRDRSGLRTKNGGARLNFIIIIISLRRDISRSLLDREGRRAITSGSHQTNAIVQNEYISLVVNGAS